MKNLTIRVILALACLGASPLTASAQRFTDAGTRAAGMGGAFVGMADDATAIYWNPAGLASGSFFSLVMDLGSADVEGSLLGSAEGSAFTIALTTPALGLGYYRLHARTARTPLVLTANETADSSRHLSAAGTVRLDSLVTHHAGVTLVQSLTQGVAVGTTLKLVRGLASSQAVSAASAGEALDLREADVFGRASNTFDLDVGIMAYGGPLRVGLTLRNVREPEFETVDPATTLSLERQARAGVSYAVTSGWIAAADVDLTRSRDALGDRRDVAVGVEGRLSPKASVRTGFRVNTVGDEAADDRAGTFSVGGSYAVRSAVFIDGHFSGGSDRAGRAWGVAARFVY